MRVLCADVGGTKTRLAVAAAGEGSVHLRVVRSYPSEEHDSLAEIVEVFLAEVEEEQIAAACFGVPGPVRDGRARTTNLPWLVEERELESMTGIPEVRLINDFSAVGRGIELLTDDEAEVLQEGEADPGGCRAYLGAGTGLGEGFLVPRSGGWEVHPSEGGHSDYAPACEVEWELRGWLSRRHGGRVSWERVVSGPGLVALYEFLRETGRDGCGEVDRLLEAGEDAAPAISRRAGEGCGTCGEAMEIFLRAYGAEAGNLALKVLATGGLWVAGGIAPDIVGRLREGAFLDGFRNKGRFRELMEAIPVRVILDTRIGLRGAAAVAEEIAR